MLPTPREITFRPNTEAVEAAEQDLAVADLAVVAAQAAVVAAQAAAVPVQETAAAGDALAAAEQAYRWARISCDIAVSARAAEDPEFTLRTPTPETSALVEYHLRARGMVNPGNAALLTALNHAVADGRVTDPDAVKAVAEAQEQWNDSARIESETFQRVFTACENCPGEAGDRGPADLIGLRMLSNQQRAIESVKVHLKLPGQRNPLSSEALRPYADHLRALAVKIDQLSVVSDDEKKR